MEDTKEESQEELQEDQRQDEQIEANDENSEHHQAKKKKAFFKKDDSKEKIEQLTKEVADLNDRLLRKIAEFENFRKRTEQEKQDLRKFATEGLMKELLPVLDSFHRSADTINESDSAQKVHEGFKLILAQLQNVLEKGGLQPFDCVGDDFDPNIHMALSYQESEDKDEGIVIQEYQKGYNLNGKLLKPAMVVVSKGKEKKEEKNE